MRFPQGEGVGVRGFDPSNPGRIGSFRGISLISSLCALRGELCARLGASCKIDFC